MVLLREIGRWTTDLRWAGDEVGRKVRILPLTAFDPFEVQSFPRAVTLRSVLAAGLRNPRPGK